jgi:hypothetical protein
MNPSQWKEVADFKVWFYDLVIVGSKDGHSLVFLTRWSIRKQRNAKIVRNCRKVEHAVFNGIKVTYLLWSLAGGVFLKPLFVVQLSIV